MKLLEITRDNIGGKIGLLPIGSIEQHGPHLPMGTDSIIAETIARKVEEKYKEDVILFPTIFYGCSLEHSGFPFMGISYVTMIKYMIEILKTTKKSGLKSVIIINAHGGNESVLDVIKRQINFTSKHFKVYIFSLIGKNNDLFNVIDMHSGSLETSIIKAINPNLVKEDKIKEIKDYSVKDGVFNTITTYEANPYGVINIGGKIEIDENKGKIFIDRAVSELEKLLINIK